MLGADLLSDALRFLLQRQGRFLVAGGHAAVDAEGQAHQRMAEEQALDLGQRQHADDLAGTLRVEEIAAMAELLFDQPEPGGAMEEACAGAGQDKGIPGLGNSSVMRRKALDGEVGLHQAGLEIEAPRPRKISSMRPQAKSPSNCLMRSWVREMFT